MGQLGHSHDMCIKTHLQNVLHLILGFTFGVWVFIFKFGKINNIKHYFIKKSKNDGYFITYTI
jgi:hypothetical protein